MDDKERLVKLISAPQGTLEKIDLILMGKHATVTDDRRLLTFTDAAKALQVSRATIHRMVDAERLPTVETLHGRRRIPSAALTALIEGRAAE